MSRSSSSTRLLETGVALQLAVMEVTKWSDGQAEAAEANARLISVGRWEHVGMALPQPAPEELWRTNALPPALAALPRP